MKYTVRNIDLIEIASTDSFREAFRIADDGTTCNTIYREDGIRMTVSEAAEIITFTNSLIMASTEGRYPMTYSEAMYNLTEMSQDGVEEPRFITSEVFADCWNEGIEEENEDPAKKEYLLKTVFEGIKQASVKTGKQIADIYDMDQLCGIYASMEVWDLDTMQRISLLDLVEPILEQKRWMEQEYRDYCENEAYGDY